MEKYTKLIGEAQTYDIQNISIDEFLNYMGWKGEVETISFGRGAKPEGVLRREGGAAAGASGDSRPRRPPEAGAGGAF
jgi:hypothetical protein